MKMGGDNEINALSGFKIFFFFLGHRREDEKGRTLPEVSLGGPEDK